MAACPSEGSKKASLEAQLAEMLEPKSRGKPEVPLSLRVVNTFTWPEPPRVLPFDADANESGGQLKSKLAMLVGYLAVDVQLHGPTGEALVDEVALGKQGLRSGDSIRLLPRSKMQQPAGGLGTTSLLPSKSAIERVQRSAIALGCVSDHPHSPVLVRMLQLHLGLLPGLDGTNPAKAPQMDSILAHIDTLNSSRTPTLDGIVADDWGFLGGPGLCEGLDGTDALGMASLERGSSSSKPRISVAELASAPISLTPALPFDELKDALHTSTLSSSNFARLGAEPLQLCNLSGAADDGLDSLFESLLSWDGQAEKETADSAGLALLDSGFASSDGGHDKGSSGRREASVTHTDGRSSKRRKKSSSARPKQRGYESRSSSPTRETLRQGRVLCGQRWRSTNDPDGSDCDNLSNAESITPSTEELPLDIPEDLGFGEGSSLLWPPAGNGLALQTRPGHHHEAVAASAIKKPNSRRSGRKRRS